MGRSVTCTFSVHVATNEGEVIYGAMSIKQARGVMLSEQQYRQEKNLSPVTCARIWAQTSRGRNYLGRYDYAEMKLTGEIEKKFIS